MASLEKRAKEAGGRRRTARREETQKEREEFRKERQECVGREEERKKGPRKNAADEEEEVSKTGEGKRKHRRLRKTQGDRKQKAETIILEFFPGVSTPEAFLPLLLLLLPLSRTDMYASLPPQEISSQGQKGLEQEKGRGRNQEVDARKYQNAEKSFALFLHHSERRQEQR